MKSKAGFKDSLSVGYTRTIRNVKTTMNTVKHMGGTRGNTRMTQKRMLKCLTNKTRRAEYVTDVI